MVNWKWRKMNEEEFLKEHPGLEMEYVSSSDIKSIEAKTNYGEYWISITKVHKTQIDKRIIEKAVDKIRKNLTNIKENLDEEKLKEIENFGNENRDDREKGYMRWAFEDGAVEALVELKKELKLKWKY